MDYTSLRYIVAVANNVSISQAAEQLFVSQPNISKTIQNVEKEIGFQIFLRTSKGIEITDTGKEFVNRAKILLSEFDDFMDDYHQTNSSNFTFTISYPRATYIASSLTKFFNTLKNKKNFTVSMYETNSTETIYYVVRGVCNIGIIRCNDLEMDHYSSILKQHNLNYIPLYKFRMQALMSKDHPLAKCNNVCKEDLIDYVAVIHANPEIVDTNFIKNNFYYGNKNIRVHDRGVQMTVLENIKDSYMMVSPMPYEYLEKNNCTTVTYDSPTNYWQDLLIYKNNHRLSKTEQNIILSIQDMINNHIKK